MRPENGVKPRHLAKTGGNCLWQAKGQKLCPANFSVAALRRASTMAV
jgi:hypothetical protein